MKRLYYLIALLGIFFQAQALDEALKPIKQAIVRADLSYVNNGLRNHGPLNPEDKKELLAVAQKWSKYRVTILNSFDRFKIYGGMTAIATSVMPFIVYRGSALLRAWINRTRDGFKAFMIIFGAIGAYGIFAGIMQMRNGWSAGGTRIIEKNAKAIVQLLEKAAVVKTEEEEAVSQEHGQENKSDTKRVTI